MYPIVVGRHKEGLFDFSDRLPAGVQFQQEDVVVAETSIQGRRGHIQRRYPNLLQQIPQICQ